MRRARIDLLLTHTINLESDIEPEPLRRIAEHEVEDRTAVIHVVNIDDFEALEDHKKPNQAPTNLNSKLVITLFLSIALHAIAFYVISLRIQLPTFSEETEKPIIVQARLYTPPPIPVVEPEIIETTPSETLPKPQVQEQRTSVQSDEVPPVEDTVVIEEAPPRPVEVNEAEVAEPMTIVTELNKAPVDLPEESAPQIPLVKPKSIYSSRAETDLRALQQRRLNRLASEAARDFQYNKTHPDLNTSPKTQPQLTAEEERAIADQKLYSQRPTIKTNCKKTGGKVLNILGSLVGGAVQCQKTPGIKSFIKKRVEKEN